MLFKLREYGFLEGKGKLWVFPKQNSFPAGAKQEFKGLPKKDFNFYLLRPAPSSTLQTIFDALTDFTTSL